MRVLKHAILGFLDKCQMSGYDIMMEFKEREIGQFWSAKHSQIYPELKKLLDEGLIEYHIEVQGTKLEKKVYSITEKGRNELKIWLSKLDEDIITPKDDFMLKAYFVSSISKEEAKLIFENRLNQHKVKKYHLENKFAKLVEENSPIKYGSENFGHYLVLSRAVERERTYVNWLEESIKLF